LWTDPDNTKPKTTMKTKTIIILLASALATMGIASAETGRCGQPRGTCNNECDGSGFYAQGRGNGGGGNGGGGGYRRGPKDGTGKGEGRQDRQRKRDGSGPGCQKAE